MNLWSKAIYCCSDYCFTAMYFNSTENAIDMWTAIATTCTQLWWLKTAARNCIFWNMCVDSICLGEHLFVNLDKSSGEKMVWHRTERKKRKKNKVNGWFSEPFDYEKSKQKCCCLRSFIVTYHILVCSFISLHLPTTYARERLVLSSVLLFHRENCVSMCGER